MKRTPLLRRTALRKVNPKRLARLKARQFGEKAVWIRSLPCCVSGTFGNPEWPVDAAHVCGTRGAGAGPEGMAPLWRPVHSDFDVLPDGKFTERWGSSKAYVRDRAAALEAVWQRLCAEAANA